MLVNSRRASQDGIFSVARPVLGINRDMAGPNRASIDQIVHASVPRRGFACDVRQLPLLSTRHDVVIRGGLATVETLRVYRNFEPMAIEATLTLPLPVHAILLKLELSIDDKMVLAHVADGAEAPGANETTHSLGTILVDHVEAIRGLHAISIAQLPPGAEVVVSAAWVTSLTGVRRNGHLRLPIDARDVYGPTMVADDDATSVKSVLTVASDTGIVYVGDQRLDGGAANLSLRKAIDIVVRDWEPKPLTATDAEGRNVVLTIKPANTSATAVQAAILIDCSSPMREPCGDGHGNLSKADVARAALFCAAECMGPEDAIQLCECSDRTVMHGWAIGSAAFRDLAHEILGSGGNTPIGEALEEVALYSPRATDVLVITDGHSRALDIPFLARTGKRFHAVLVGTTDWDARICYLAELTGGSVVSVSDTNVYAAVEATFQPLRGEAIQPALTVHPDTAISIRRRGMELAAQWRPLSAAAMPIQDHPVSVFAASMVGL